MSQPTQAERLAAVCRVLWPKRTSSWDSISVTVWDRPADESPRHLWSMNANSLDTYARLVAVLDVGQRGRFDNYVWTMRGHGDDRAHPSDVLTAPPETLLAALECAVGIKA